MDIEDPIKPVTQVPSKKKIPTPVDPRRQKALAKKFSPHEAHMNHLNHVNHMKQNVAKTNVGKSGFKFRQ